MEQRGPGGIQPDMSLGGLPLTPREVEVLTLVSHGKSNPEIARKLSLTEYAVKGHVSLILAKLQAANRAHAVRLGAESGVLAFGPALGGAPAPAPVKPAPPPVLPKLGRPVRDLLAQPPGTILADKFGDAVQRISSGGFWLLGEHWPMLASEVVDRGPFEVLRRPGGAP